MRTELALVVALIIPSMALGDQGPGTVDSTVEALEELNAFLDFEEPGLKRREELKYDQLFDLVVEGPTGDVKKLEEHLAILEKQDKGPDLKIVAKIRDRLKEHIAAVRQNQAETRKIIGDLPEYQPFDSAQFLAAKQRSLDKSILRVERYLTNSGLDNAIQWKEHFEWSELLKLLEEEKQADRGSARRYVRLSELHNNFYDANAGYGQDPFVELREHLEEYLYAVLLEKGRPAKERLTEYLAELEKAVMRYEWNGDPTARSDIGFYTKHLKLAGQAEALVKKLRGRYWHPNIYVQVSEEMAGAGVNDVIDDVSPISDYMMKTSIRGTAFTRGEFRIAMAPADRGVSLAVCVDATANSVSTGTRGKVQVHSTGVTTIRASKALYFSENGQLSGQPSAAQCDTDSQITGVSHKRKFVRKIAYNKAMKYKPTGENYASRKGEAQAVEELDNQVNPLITKGNRAYEDKIRRPLIGLDLFPKWHNLMSTYRDVGGKFLVATNEQLGAPNHAPALPARRYAATLRVHESAISNVADTLIRSYTLDRQKSIDLLKKLEREIPPELMKEEEWSMTFADENSVVVNFEDNLVRLGFRGQRFSANDRSVNVEIEFSAKYRVDLQPRAAVLHREGNVEANVITDRRIPPADLAIRDVILKKFEAVFEPTFTIESQKLPEPYDKAGDILPGHFTAGYGWATVGINAANVRIH